MPPRSSRPKVLPRTTAQKAKGPSTVWRKGPSFKVLCICKPGSVPPRGSLHHLSRSHLTTGLHRPTLRAPTCVGRTGFPRSGITERTVYMVFQRVRFTKLPCRQKHWCALTAPFHPYPSCEWRFPFLRHFLWTTRSQVAPFPLGSTLPDAARTFLPPPCGRRRWSDAQDVKEQGR